jgi:hypothetical protein
MRIQSVPALILGVILFLPTASSNAQCDHAKSSADATDTHAHSPSANAADHAFAIPEGLVIEHDEIHERLVALLDEPAPVGPAARKLADLLHHHFPLENEIALPPLGWLTPMAEGAELPDATAMIAKTDSLRDLLPGMLEEHVRIHEAAEALHEAGIAAKSQNAIRFALELKAHARHEEEILYPAAILVGDLLRQRVHKHHGDMYR